LVVVWAVQETFLLAAMAALVVVAQALQLMYQEAQEPLGRVTLVVLVAGLGLLAGVVRVQ
jgi:hypothetical protein